MDLLVIIVILFTGGAVLLFPFLRKFLQKRSNVVTVAQVRDLGAMPFAKEIRGRDGGYSACFKGRSVWVFGDTVLDSNLDSGNNWRTSTCCWTTAIDLQKGEITCKEILDSQGLPSEFIPFTLDEEEYNRINNRQSLPEEHRSRWALWPGPIVIDPDSGQAYIFYFKVYAKPGPFNFEHVGASLAIWINPDEAVQRPVLAAETAEPTLLFPKGDVSIGNGALIVGEWLYAYGTLPSKTFACPCIVGRVKLTKALNRKKWRFYAGKKGWVEDWKEAIVIMDAAPILSIHWNPYFKKYLAVYSNPISNTISVRSANRPEGPWSKQNVMVVGMSSPNHNVWNYCGLAHPEFSLENGRIEYWTYYRDLGAFRGEVRLVEVRYQRKGSLENGDSALSRVKK